MATLTLLLQYAISIFEIAHSYAGVVTAIAGPPIQAVQPVPESSVSKVDDRTLENRERWWKRGLRAISEGKLAVVLLAGGQVL